MTSTLSTQNSASSASTAVCRIALAGNPNAGKTTLFNALTGMRQKVGNYPGVTVEKKEGRCALPTGEATILDLPGTYSLSPKSPDEEIARDILLGLRPDTPVPDAVAVVVDASNLERNLYLATQVLELGLPTVIVLNMGDVARAGGHAVSAQKLSQALGVPVVETIAVRGEGLKDLREALAGEIASPQPPELKFPDKINTALDALSSSLKTPCAVMGLQPRGVALRLLAGNATVEIIAQAFGDGVAQQLESLRAELKMTPGALSAAEASARYGMLGDVVQQSLEKTVGSESRRSFSDKADVILTHKVWGLGIFSLITLLVFMAIFSWASIPMDLIEGALTALGQQVSSRMAEGPLRDLIVDGVIAGVGAVLVFLPQILILFFFIGLLEDSGYMARAAFLMDRLMSKVGLHGRAFIPLMSSFACAIPGIMAARTLSNRRDRMTTILIAPLMSCSARIPVYTLMIATFIPNIPLLGFFIGGKYFGVTLPVAVMFGLYAFGVLTAMAMAWIFKRTLFQGPPPALVMELPPYKMPAWRNVTTTMWDRSSQFLKRAGTIILAISIVLWFLLNYPKVDTQRLADAAPDANIAPAAGIRPGPGNAPPVANERAEDKATKKAGELSEEEQLALQTRYSFAGQIGHALEPVIAPLGFNWKIGIGLIGAMSAREVFVSTIGSVYAVGDADETSDPLKEQMKGDRWPDGRPVWTTLVAVSLLVYFVLAMQCISTVAVIKRETNSWKWALFAQFYMTALAWFAAFAVYQIGRALGWG